MKTKNHAWLIAAICLVATITFVNLAVGGILTGTAASSGGSQISIITITNNSSSLSNYILLAGVPTTNSDFSTTVVFTGRATTTSGGLLNMIWADITTNPPSTNFTIEPAAPDSNTNDPQWSNTYISTYPLLFLEDTNIEIVSCEVTHVYVTNTGTNTVTNSCNTNTNYSPEWSVSMLPSWITRDGTFISSANSNNVVCVGQQMNLSSVTAGPWGESNHTWAMPGVYFKDYQPNVNNSHYTAISNSDITSPSISYYWSYSDSNSIITDTVSVYGQTLPVKAALNVQRPVASISIRQGTLGVGMGDSSSFTNGLPYLYCGTDVGTNQGITFSQTLTEPPSFTGGTNEWVQYVNNVSINWTLTNGTVNTLGGSGCDTTYPYPFDEGTNGTSDSPDALLTNNDSSISETFSATMYLMWKPPANHVGGDSVVFVPLRQVAWNWNATATNATPTNYNSWQLPISNFPSTTDTNATLEPTWSNNVQPLH